MRTIAEEESWAKNSRAMKRQIKHSQDTAGENGHARRMNTISFQINPCLLANSFRPTRRLANECVFFYCLMLLVLPASPAPSLTRCK